MVTAAKGVFCRDNKREIFSLRSLVERSFCQAGTSSLDWDSHCWQFTAIAPGQLCWAPEPPEAGMESHWVIWIQALIPKLPTLESWGKNHCPTLVLSTIQGYQQTKSACLSFMISLLLWEGTESQQAILGAHCHRNSHSDLPQKKYSEIWIKHKYYPAISNKNSAAQLVIV